MSRLPTAVIPVTVDTRDVDAGVRHIQHKMAGLQKKLAKAGGPSSVGRAGLGLRASNATAFLGGVGKLGAAAGALAPMGAAGAALAAPAALIGMARANVEAMAAMTKGAGDAFQKFRESGEQSFAINSQMLRLMASAEADAQAAAKRPGIIEGFRQGGLGIDQGGAGILERISDFAGQASATLGAYFGGKGIEESMLSGRLATTDNEELAAAIAAQLRTLEQERMRGEISFLDAAFGSFNAKVEQLGVIIGRLM